MLTFLSAYWKNLVFVNYEADVALLTPYLPHGTEPDFCNGRCLVSLVGFLFLNTKVKGIGFPFHRNFEEFNLRFYVRRRINNEYRRGVVFVKEIVPRRMISWVAYQLYGEKYFYHPMRNSLVETASEVEINYSFRVHKRWNSIAITADKKSEAMMTGTEEEFITEHYWGYTRLADGRTSEYQVDHPRWNLHQVNSYQTDIDVETLYGKQWLPCLTAKPTSVFMAEGSPVTVFNRNLLNK